MLHAIQLPDLSRWTPSAAAERLIGQAERRIQRFAENAPLIHGFVASDFRAADAHLGWIAQQHLATGRAFCEWGSGFGVVAMLASLHQFDACGIEVEAELVAQARCLAEDLRIAAQFAHGSAIPHGWTHGVGYLQEMTHVDLDSADGYDELDMQIADFDLVFVFPWPGEERFWDELFQRRAAPGALLLTYHGVEGFRLQRRVRPRRRRY